MLAALARLSRSLTPRRPPDRNPPCSPQLVDIYGAEAAYEQFSKTFHEGVDAFIKGDWPTAQQKLEGAHDFCPKDAPTMLLMREMKKRSIDPNTPTAPVDWKGYHDSDV